MRNPQIHADFWNRAAARELSEKNRILLEWLRTRSFGSIGFPLFVDGVMFLIMALVLIFKPSGLFGRVQR